MFKSKINPLEVKDMAWKDYVKKLKLDMKKAESIGLEKTPCVMISDFTYVSGENQALLLLGKKSALKKYYKGLKKDEERKKLKDYSFGFCHFEKEEDGSSAIKIAIKGFGKPAKMKKNSRKIFKKAGIKVKDIIKGDFIEDNEQGNSSDINELSEEKVQNNLKLLLIAAQDFAKANKLINKEVLPLLVLSKKEKVVYLERHVTIAKEAFRTAGSFSEMYNEIIGSGENNEMPADKIVNLMEAVQQKGLVEKYRMVWKKISNEYNKQMDEFSQSLKSKFEELNNLIREIKNTK